MATNKDNVLGGLPKNILNGLLFPHTQHLRVKPKIPENNIILIFLFLF